MRMNQLLPLPALLLLAATSVVDAATLRVPENPLSSLALAIGNGEVFIYGRS